MSTIQLCRNCAMPAPADAPQGLCPRCLMEAGLESNPRATSSENPPTPAELAGHFPQLEILELIGRGGMGIVYKARQMRLDRVVALKILPPEVSREPSFAERFDREARALAKLNHPNIVSIYDSGQSDGLYYFVMEFVDGTNLRQALQTGHISPREALAIVPLICDALQYAHDLGIVHRDIKPENVLLDKTGRVKIADFGLAKLINPTTADVTLTMAGSAMGTPKYMAPEQMDTPGAVDHRADIYSLGVVFYEMLTGELPVGRFALPSQKVSVDVRLDEVVLRTLEQKPERRYQQASEVKTEVETITGYFEKLPQHVRNAIGFEYKSKTTLFGLPLLHVAHGLDPTTGRLRVATGIFAFGARARGVFACGGMAFGVVAFGGMAVGLLSMGGIGLGLLSMSGISAAFLFGYGGISIAPIAVGGIPIGYCAVGGLPIAVHGNDGVAMRAIGNYIGLDVSIFGLAAFLLSMAAAFIIPNWAKRARANAAAASK